MAVKLIIKPFLYDQVSMNVEVDSEYFELAEIYGYTTSRFNEQVANNIEKFEGEDFCFYLTQDEYKNLMSKKSTSSWGGRRKPPRAFIVVLHQRMLQRD